ncbi:MAG: cation/acetate symporter [Pseudonocardiales bacterium]|uniref:sodium/solute symporter n=1 Tax=Pseudonocardia sp. Cha107L01 TaxID=3457576 RepID=UPI0028CADB59|nr:cation/acetate symporter [Pseudonocardiales bacterium]MDT7610649.1 cation/acetate symporter [Pseudonocardiales bacterium]MDT7644332.1 cation/acetate symporter [Pseudonocardiales bacterium]MDT7660729.1 cation/acetate symporter [Pseudonocardiales bacterium]MDT7671427.1 cation/acetate symporter [Pseudonocardiales bacterium]
MIAAAIVLVVLVTLLIGARGVAAIRSTSDFLVASRRISPTLNAAAVSGEYLSAASFLGVAGLVLKDGIGALWYGVGFTAGYIAMLALVAAPMRRTGALTVPDFAEARLGSAGLRKLSAVVVLVIATLYLVPQFKAAGLVLTVVTGTPYWVGVVVAGAAVSITLALGGMRAATYVQAFQFGLKLLLFIIPAIWLVSHVGADTRRDALAPVEFTRFDRAAPVEFRLDVELTITEPTPVSISGGAAEVLRPGRYEAVAGSTWTFPAGAAVPKVDGALPPGGDRWSRPLLDPNDSGYPLLSTLSLLMATVLGAMGLPHIIVRFHTSSDGRGARRTAAITVALLSVFYLFPAVYGVLGAVLLPELYLAGGTDTVVVALPARVDSGWAGSLFTAMLSAGAFAAFLATSLGLLLALSGAVSHDLLPGATVRRLRLTTLGAAVLVVALALPAAHLDVGALVTSAFAVAASTFCPLLVLGIWWARLTARGAVVGMVVGLVSSAGVIGASFFLATPPGLAATLLGQPALWSVPLAFLTMVLVSLRGRPPAWATAAMLRLHLDETERSRQRR